MVIPYGYRVVGPYAYAEEGGPPGRVRPEELSPYWGMSDLGQAGGDFSSTGFVVSVAIMSLGLILPLVTVKRAPMPASLRRLFRTEVAWYEPPRWAEIAGWIFLIGGAAGGLYFLVAPRLGK